MTRRQLILNIFIAVALSALHRIIEESAILAMRFTAGKMSDYSTGFDPYLYRSPSLKGGVSGYQGNGGDKSRPAGNGTKPAYNPYAGKNVTALPSYMYDMYDPYDVQR
jgi:hypothetical protein